MSRNHMPKKERHEKLVEKLTSDPFLTDEELADLFNVSVPTIRLDRLSWVFRIKGTGAQCSRPKFRKSKDIGNQGYRR